MCIKSLPQSRRAHTLLELLVGIGIFVIASVALASIFLFSTKSFAALANYAILDIENRQALDHLSREIRQAKMVKSFATNSYGNSITIVDADDQNVTFTFDRRRKSLTRTVGTASETMLTNCSLLDFHLYQRNPSNGNYGVFPIASGNWTQTVKVVQLTWKTQRQIPAGPVNSENIQTARIVIRKQQDN